MAYGISMILTFAGAIVRIEISVGELFEHRGKLKYLHVLGPCLVPILLSYVFHFFSSQTLNESFP